MNMNNPTHRFITDITLPGCVVQAGPVATVRALLTPENYQSFLDTHSDTDLYFLAGVDPARDMQRARDEDVRSINHFFIDLDIRAVWKKNGDEIADAQIKETGDWLAEHLAQHPTFSDWRYIVFTGNGLHLYYFGDPVALTSTEHWREGMQAVLREFQEYTQLEPDMGCCNAARLKRLPSSINHKGGARKRVEIMHHHPDAVTDIARVLQFGAGSTPHVRSAATTLTAKAWEAGMEGVGIGQRNTTAASVAGKLLQGVPESMWEVAAWGGMKEWNARNTPPMPEKELRSVFDSIAKKHRSTEKQGQRGGDVPVLVRLADVEREEVQWLWQDRIPQGKLTMLDGDPSAGKSWLSLAIASALTLGAPLPGQNDASPPANVLLLTAEDGLANTIRPRMEDMGADLSRVQCLQGVQDKQGKERHLSLEDDLASIASVLEAGGYALVVIDPLNAYLGSTLDTNRDAALRSVLTPLTQMAEKYNVALLAIRHLTKSPRTRAIYRGQGSIAYTAAARVAHLVGRNPQDPEERIMVCIKNNLAPFPSAIAYEVHEGQFSWRGETDIAADALLGPDGSQEGETVLEKAKAFLMCALAEESRPADVLLAEAKDANISERTLKRAKSELGIESTREGFGGSGQWMWSLSTHQSVPKNDLAPFENIPLPTLA